MTAVLAALLAVAVLVIAFLGLRLAGARRVTSAPQLEEERDRAERAEREAERSRAALARVEGQVEAIQQSLETLRRRAEVAERRAAEADKRTDGAERRAESAERRASDAESLAAAAESLAAAERARAQEAASRANAAEARVALAERLAAEAESRAAAAESVAAAVDPPVGGGGANPSSVTAGAGSCLWELERLRAEREWADVVGPGVPLPAEWGTLRAALETELAVIREVIGTPSELHDDAGAHPPADPLSGTVAARLAAELLRTLGRAGDEMKVRLSPGALVVEQPADTSEVDLRRLASAARAVGAAVDRQGQVTSLRLPPSDRPTV